MNEVTRIHIAKIPYDIEIDAKKSLEKYLRELKKYINDDDVYGDIEIRITEILLSRGTGPNGVIDSRDVSVIRKQLGEPHEFNSGNDVDDFESDDNGRRILYRDLDGALLGGVLSGIGKYLSVDATWVRLIFVVLLFVSFGSAMLLYFVLWFIVPPAITASDKLRLTGRPVDAKSIRELGESTAGHISSKAPVLRKFLSIAIGIGSGLVAIGVIIMVMGISMSSALRLEGLDVVNLIQNQYGFDRLAAWLIIATIVFGVLMFVLMWAQLSYVFITRKFTKKSAYGLIAVVVAGIISVAVVIGAVFVQSEYTNSQAQKMTREFRKSLPSEFKLIDNIVVGGKDRSNISSITYIVSDSTPKYIVSGVAGTRLDVRMDDKTAYLDLFVPTLSDRYNIQPSISIYGPALKSITNFGSQFDYEGQNGGSLIISNGSGSVYLSGSFDKLSVSGNGSIDASGSSVRVLEVDSKGDFTVDAGTVESLDVKQPSVCPSGTDPYGNYVHVDALNSSSYLYNGTVIKVAPHHTNCGQVVIGEDDWSE